MNKRKPKEEKPRLDIRAQFLNSETGKDFVAWWKNHRFSGYTTKGDRERWNMDPYTASKCSRYMAEYCSDRKLAHEGCFEYSAEEYEQWARDQKESKEAVAIFAESHNGREVPTLDEFRAGLREAVAKMRDNFGSLSREAKQPPELKYWDKEALLPDAPIGMGMTPEQINARNSLMANQADATRIKYEDIHAPIHE